jgi:hypothetical protein
MVRKKDGGGMIWWFASWARTSKSKVWFIFGSIRYGGYNSTNVPQTELHCDPNTFKDKSKCERLLKSWIPLIRIKIVPRLVEGARLLPSQAMVAGKVLYIPAVHKNVPKSSRTSVSSLISLNGGTTFGAPTFRATRLHIGDIDCKTNQTDHQADHYGRTSKLDPISDQRTGDGDDGREYEGWDCEKLRNRYAVAKPTKGESGYKKEIAGRVGTYTDPLMMDLGTKIRRRR